MTQTDTTQTGTAKALGPRQLKEAQRTASLIPFWAADLETALAFNEVEKIAKLTTAIIEATQAVAAIAARATR